MDGISAAPFSIALLATQFAAQPFLVLYCSGNGVTPQSLVVATEAIKLLYCAVMLSLHDLRAAGSWTLGASLRSAGVPSVTFAAQNVLMQVAYQQLDALVVNLGNQTKLFSTAIFCYFLLGQTRCAQQVFALGLICLGSTLGCTENKWAWTGGAVAAPPVGLLALLGASALSGVGASLSELTLRKHKRNTYLFSMELSMYSLVCMGVGLAVTGGHQPSNFFAGWTPATLLPALTQAAGGILVGRVTKECGSVAKCFAVILGILLTAVFRSLLTAAVSGQLLLSCACVISGIALHQVDSGDTGFPMLARFSFSGILMAFKITDSKKKSA